MATRIALGALAVNNGRGLIRTSTNILYAAFYNPGNTALQMYRSADNGATWAIQDYANSPPGGGTGRYAVAIDGNDTIHIANRPPASTTTIQHITFNTTTNTFGPIESFDSAMTAVPAGITIVVDGNNVPHIVATSAQPKTVYYNRIGGSWKNVTINSLTSFTLDIAIDQNNVPQIITRDNTNGIIVWIGNKNNATSFTSNNIASNAAITGTTSSIAIDSNSATWVTYISAGAGLVNLAQHISTKAWSAFETTINDNFTGNTPTLAIDGTDIYVLYERRLGGLAYDKYDSVNRVWLGEQILQPNTPAMTTNRQFHNPKAKWSNYFDNGLTGANNQNSNLIEYLFDDGTNVYYDKIDTAQISTELAQFNFAPPAPAFTTSTSSTSSSTSTSTSVSSTSSSTSTSISSTSSSTSVSTSTSSTSSSTSISTSTSISSTSSSTSISTSSTSSSTSTSTSISSTSSSISISTSTSISSTSSSTSISTSSTSSSTSVSASTSTSSTSSSTSQSTSTSISSTSSSTSTSLSSTSSSTSVSASTSISSTSSSTSQSTSTSFSTSSTSTSTTNSLTTSTSSTSSSTSISSTSSSTSTSISTSSTSSSTSTSTSSTSSSTSTSTSTSSTSSSTSTTTSRSTSTSSTSQSTSTSLSTSSTSSSTSISSTSSSTSLSTSSTSTSKSTSTSSTSQSTSTSFSTSSTSTSTTNSLTTSTSSTSNSTSSTSSSTSTTSNTTTMIDLGFIPRVTIHPQPLTTTVIQATTALVDDTNTLVDDANIQVGSQLTPVANFKVRVTTRLK